MIFAGVAALLMGGGRLSATMGNLGKGLREFKKGLGDHDGNA
jgi:Sec-independent protein translocase protein TatA